MFLPRRIILLVLLLQGKGFLLYEEKQQLISNETNNENRIADFWNSDKRCTMTYCIDTEERIKNMEEN